MQKYFKKEGFSLICGNCLEILPEIQKGSVSMIFADPPYNLSNGGISCKNGKMVCVNKGDWDKSNGFEKDFQFTYEWLKLCKDLLKDNGTIWVSGTPHNIYQVGYALQKLGFHILNEISWFKPNGPPNLSCRYFSHSHETLIWARKNKKCKHIFNYEETKNWEDKINPKGKQTRSVWSIPLTPKSEKIYGDHPTQKPEELLRRIILSSTNEGDLILDPFNGSGTTGIVSNKLKRDYIGIDKEEKYLDISKKRLNSLTEIAISD